MRWNLITYLVRMPKTPQRGKGSSPCLHAFQSRGQKKEAQGSDLCICFLDLWKKTPKTNNERKDFLLIKKEGRRQDTYFRDMLVMLRNIYLENDTKIPGSRQQCSSGKVKKEGIKVTTFKNIVYRELL